MSESNQRPPSLLEELKRRKVFRAAAVYAVVAWLVIQIAVTTFPYLGLPRWMITGVIAVVLLGFPLALVLAWSLDLTPSGMRRERGPSRAEDVSTDGAEAAAGEEAAGAGPEDERSFGGPDEGGATSSLRVPVALGVAGLAAAAATGFFLLDLPGGPESGGRGAEEAAEEAVAPGAGADSRGSSAGPGGVDAGGASSATAGGPLPVTHLEQLTFSGAVEEYPAFSSDGTRLVFSREVRGFEQLFVRDLESGEETQLTSAEADHIQPAWSPAEGVVLYVRATGDAGKLEPADFFGPYSGGDIWRMEIATGRQRRILEDAYNPAFSPDGSRIAFDASWVGSRRIWIADALGRNPEQATTDVSESVAHVAPSWSPGGEAIAFQSIEKTKMDVRTVHLPSGRMHRVTDDLLSDVDPHWAPGGGKIYFTSYRGGGRNLWRAPVVPEGAPAGPPQQVTAGAGSDVQVSLDPTGGRLAFVTRKLNADLWRLPVSPETGMPRGEPEPVVATTREDSRGSWSPDGSRIAFNSDRTGEMNLWIHTLEDSSTRRLTTGPGGDFQPRWSPDAERIVFFSSRAGNADIWAVDVATGVLQQLTGDPALDVNPFYSPDGRRIAFQSDRGGRKEVWLMAADGTGQRQLSTGGAADHFMVWTPDGDSILYNVKTREGNSQYELSVEEGERRPFRDVRGGYHMSFSPDSSLVMDVAGHKVLWVTPVGNAGEIRGAESGSTAPAGLGPRQVFEFEDPEVRIDYPVWSPDGRWVLFDRSRPTGSDVWLLELAPSGSSGVDTAAFSGRR